MAARRLIIVLVVLFAISIAAAAIAPQRRPVTSTTETSTTTTSTAITQTTPGGGEVSKRLLASASSPETVRAVVGDQLSLSVAAKKPLEVEILEPYGLIANAGPAAPAVFNILLHQPGTAGIVDTSSGSVVGRLIVKAVAASPKPK